MNNKKNYFSLISALLVFASCSNGKIAYAESRNIENSSNYISAIKAFPNAVITEDLYENFAAEGTVSIKFSGDSFTSSFEGAASENEISIKKVENSEKDEISAGVEIQYKGSAKIKYILSGNYNGTVFIKNKKADAAVVLNNVNLTSADGSGPVLRFSAEDTRTFIVVPADTTNTLTDTRLLNQSSTMYDDKKGSVYAKGTLIFTGETSTKAGGTLNIVNTGYKHAVYSKDYIRIANLNLNVTVAGKTGRDCIRALNAIIVDDGNLKLVGNGTITDDESAGLRVDGEDADDDDMTVEYTAGAGFIIINGGNIDINTVAKGITAHWKSANTVIGNSKYTATANKSLLCSSYLKGTSATKPNPFVEINGGNINVVTTGQPYEGRSDSDPSCSPEGIEAKADLTINAGTITLNTTDDAINAGGNIVINGGAIYACSSLNDGIDSNGSAGIVINDGVVVALGGNGGECAFDCDNAPLTINGGYVLGLGGGNYTAPKNCKQTTLVLGSSSTGSANTSFAIVDSKNNPVFVYTLPAAQGEVLILSSPELKTDTSYSVKTGITIKADSGSSFHNLYTKMPSISGGKESLTNISTTNSNTVYTDSNAGLGGFGGRGGFGERGGFGGFRGDNGNFGKREALDDQEEFDNRGGNFDRDSGRIHDDNFNGEHRNKDNFREGFRN